MNTKAEVTLKWADGVYLFALKAPQIDELERVCGGVGIGVIVGRVLAEQFYRKDIRETIRLGLIGGGTEQTRALELCEAYVDERPFEPGIDGSVYNVASVILQAVWYGLEELDTGEGEDSPEKPETGGSTSPDSEPASSPTA